MANSADLVAILSLSSSIILCSSSSACSDSVSGLDAACGPIRLLLANALRRIVRPHLRLSTPNLSWAKLSPAAAGAAGHKRAYHLCSTQVMPHIEVRNVSLVYDTPAGQVPAVTDVRL